MIITALFMIFFSNITWAADQRLCEYFGWNCASGSGKSGGRTSSQSLPSQSTASNLNPSNVRYAKGFGLETLYEPQNPLIFSLATGTGKLGGALITQSYENSFFGNRVIEMDDDLLHRHRFNQRYTNKKINFALGGRTIDKPFATIDAGVMGKYNKDTGRLNLGVGLSGRLGILTVGASFYKDDVKVVLKDYASPYTGELYSTIHNSDTYTESFLVETYSVGSRFRSFTFDYGILKTRYKFYNENTRIYLYSAAYSKGKFQFNAALRKEYSSQQKYDEGRMIIQRRKDTMYYGIQYSVNRHMIVGVNYNYFLLNEFSFTGTIFF